MTKTIKWFARGGGLLKCGPYDSQIEATNALRLTAEPDVFPSDAFVWPEKVDADNADDASREALWSRVEARFAPEDLDDHVHTLASIEASNINNAGLREQFDYLYDNAGVNWLEELLKEDDDG